MAKNSPEQVRKMQSAHSMAPDAVAPLVTGQNMDGSPFELTTERFGDNELVFTSAALAFAAGAAAGTEASENAPIPVRLDPDLRYAVVVFNPGAVAVTVRLFNRELLNGADRLVPVATINVAAAAVSGVQIVQGLFLGSGASLVRATNDAAVPAGGGFSVGVRIRRP